MQRSRLARLRDAMLAQGLDGFVVSSLPNIRFLSGFSGTHALIVVTRRGAWFLTDSRYSLQIRKEVSGFRHCLTGDPFPLTIAARGFLRPCRQVGIEAEHMTVAEERTFRRLLRGISLRPTTDLVESLTLVKEQAEVAMVRKAASISDRTFLQIVKEIRPGMKERDVAARISFLQMSAGADGDAFAPIVAAGVRAALPHARASERRIRSGDLVVLDFGCTVGGYHSDLTRTVAVGKASRKSREIYSVVRTAGELAIRAARPGMAARDLDAVARRHITGAGYGKYFSHSLGHGLGLQIHERPRISPLGIETLCAGSIITIEPGVYLPGWGGVRIEDDVLLTKHGCSVLTSSPKELLIL
jgi:Xaa-Pro aminopeptidase